MKEDDVWPVLRKIKLTIPFDINPVFPIMYSGNQIKNNIDAVADYLNTKTTEEMHVNRTNEDLKSAASMFLYLNCRSYLLRSWFSFFTNLFQDKSPYQIVLTLNKILKVDFTSSNKEFKNIARKLFQKTSNLLSLKHKQIKELIHGHENSLWKSKDFDKVLKGTLNLFDMDNIST